MAMANKEALLGMSWAPKLTSLTSTTSTLKKASSSSSSNLPETSTLWKPKTDLIDDLFVPPNNPRNLNKLRRKQVKDTLGKNWFDMPAQTMTPELKKDLQILKLRNVIDPKRHYKKGDSKELPKYCQVGTVIESASDFYSGRLTKKERRATLADELLSDQKLGQYRKRKVQEIEEQRQPGGVKKWKIKSRHSMMRAKQRRKAPNP